MRNSSRNRFVFKVSILCALSCAAPFVAAGAYGSGLTVLHSFQGGSDGAGPISTPLLDQQGDLYDVTASGGASNRGTVTETGSDGSERTIFSFRSTRGGRYPTGTLVSDSAGNLYGTTAFGGERTTDCYRPNGCGVVFKITPRGKEKVLHIFTYGDGDEPNAPLVMDAAGNLFGTTYIGGAGEYGSGTVFEVASDGSFRTLYTFCSKGGSCPDGYGPLAGLALDGAGNLYGTTGFGGAHSEGTVFELSSAGVETVLYSFCSATNCSDGKFPLAGVILDSSGNIYGTTYSGGANAYGTVFEVAEDGTESVLHSFAGGSDGFDPADRLVMDGSGNLYGTTGEPTGCYSSSNCGTIFMLTPLGDESVLYTFCSLKGCADGEHPSGVVMDGAGDLYGTAGGGGDKGYGTVFELTSAPEHSISSK